MTFYYDSDEDELVGNNMFAADLSYGPLAERDGDSLHIDVAEIMEFVNLPCKFTLSGFVQRIRENGRGLRKLREMQSAIESAIDAHEEE